MIDPAFEKRLENWGRAIRSGRSTLSVSATYQAMIALRLKFGPSDDSWEPSGERACFLDVRDAERLTHAWTDGRLSRRERDILCMRYAKGFSDSKMARRFRVSPNFMRAYRDTVTGKFKSIVEELDERVDQRCTMTSNLIPTA